MFYTIHFIPLLLSQFMVPKKNGVIHLSVIDLSYKKKYLLGIVCDSNGGFGPRRYSLSIYIVLY
jgi:hypothetical protein